MTIVRGRGRPALLASLLVLLSLLLAACDTTGLRAASTPTTGPARATATTRASGQQSNSGAGNEADPQIDPGAQVSADTQRVPVGSPAPGLSLPGIDGKTYSLSDQKGKIVVLEFMATWCPHCQDDAPMMNQLDAAYKSRGVQVLGINATPRGHNNSNLARMSDLKWFSDSFGVTFPLLFDKELKSAADYGVQWYPSIYVIDRQGIVDFQPPDNQVPNYDMLSGEIDKLLEK